MLPTALSTSAMTGIIRRHARSALTCAGAGVVLAATAGGATAAASEAGPAHSQASPLAAGSTASAVLSSQLTGAGTLAVPGPVTHAAASTPRQAAHPKAAAKSPAARKPQAPMSELIPHGTSGRKPGCPSAEASCRTPPRSSARHWPGAWDCARQSSPLPPPCRSPSW